jgi:DNA-directed RNA polymerase subunit RPC12/RpoP
MIACNCSRCLRERDERDERGWPIEDTRMILCQQCGNKRCPHANDHRHACTGSNASGQPGSSYPAWEDK